MTSNFPPKGHLQHCLIEDKVSFYKFKDEIIAWLMGTNFGEVILELGAFAPKAAAEPSKSSKKKEKEITSSTSTEVETQDIDTDIVKKKLEKYENFKAGLAAHMKEFVGITLWSSFLSNTEFKERLQYDPVATWKFIKHYYALEGYDLIEARKVIYDAITGYKRNGKEYTEFARDLYDLYKTAVQLEEPNSKVPDVFTIPTYFQLLDENNPFERFIRQRYTLDYLVDKKSNSFSTLFDSVEKTRIELLKNKIITSEIQQNEREVNVNYVKHQNQNYHISKVPSKEFKKAGERTTYSSSSDNDSNSGFSSSSYSSSLICSGCCCASAKFTRARFDILLDRDFNLKLREDFIIGLYFLSKASISLCLISILTDLNLGL